MAATGHISCPPAGSFVAVSGQFLVAAVMRGGGGVLQLTGRGEELVDQVTRRRRIALRGVVERMEVAERRILVDALIAFARGAGEPLAVEAVSDYRDGGDP